MNMKILGAAAALALLAGCTSNIDQVSMAKGTGSPFTQALTTEYCVQNKGKLASHVHTVPVEIEQYIASHKLTSMGIEIDELTAEQKRYMSGWEQGT